MKAFDNICMVGNLWYCRNGICHIIYSQTLLVSTPGDPPNCYSLSVVLANHIRRLVLWVISWGIISLYFLTRYVYYSLTVFLLTRFTLYILYALCATHGICANTGDFDLFIQRQKHTVWPGSMQTFMRFCFNCSCIFGLN